MNHPRSKPLAIAAALAAVALVSVLMIYSVRTVAGLFAEQQPANFSQLSEASSDGPAAPGRQNRRADVITALPEVVTLQSPSLGAASVPRNGGVVPGLIAVPGAGASQAGAMKANPRTDLAFALHPSLKFKAWGAAASDAVTGYGLHLATVENPADQSAATPPPTAPRSATQQLIDANLQMETDRHSVLAMCEDQQGCLWVAAEDSVQRFYPSAPELHQWTEFTTKDGLGDNGGTAIACDRHGRIWIGHGNNHGISIYNGQKWQSYCSAGLPDSTGELIGPLGGRVAHIATCPADGDVWIATDCGLTRYSDSKDTWQLCGLTAGEPTSLAFDQQGNIYVGTTHDGVAMADAGDNYKTWCEVKTPDQAQPAPTGTGLPSNAVNDLFVTTRGTIYVATDAGLAWSSDSGQTWQFTRGANWAKGTRHPAANTVRHPGRFLREDGNR